MTLLNVKDVLRGTANLDWDPAKKPMDNWEGVKRRFFSGQIVEGQSRDQVKVVGLDLSGRELNGVIPSELDDLTRLETLTLYNNSLTGEIPAELGNLSNLTILNLGDNQLAGEIPAELGNLSNLVSLRLSDNRLAVPSQSAGKSGIPAQLGNLSNLIILDLHNNRLPGNIPVELGNLSRLTVLNLRDNQLTGKIPPQLVEMAHLGSLHLAGNNLAGCIPQGLDGVAENDLALIGLETCKAPTEELLCASSLAVFPHADNPGLFRDCGALMMVKDTLARRGQPRLALRPLHRGLGGGGCISHG